MTLSLEPQHINPRLWYYEETAGMKLVIEVRDNSGRDIRTDQVLIPWSKIRESLKRKDDS